MLVKLLFTTSRRFVYSLDSVNIRLVAGKGLYATVRSDIPDFGRGIAGTGYENILVRRYRKRHDVASMVVKLHCLDAASMSQRMQDMSPEEVIIVLSELNLQHERSPSVSESSRAALTEPSFVLRL